MKSALLATGHREASRGNFQAAYQAFVESGTPEGEIQAGVCAAILGQPGLAKAHFERAYRANPRDTQVQRFLGMACAESDEPARALELLDGFTDPDALFLRARAAMLLGMLEEAVRDYRRVTKQQPQRASAWANLGIAQRRLGRPEAESSLTTAIRLEPTNVPALAELADSFREQGRVAESLDLYDRAVRLRPDDAPLWLSYGQALQLAKRAADAERAYRTVLKLAPDQPAAKLNLAQIRAEQGLIGEAAGLLRGTVGWAQWREALLQPTIAASTAEIDDRRLVLTEFLADEVPPLDDPSTQVGAPGFLLAYQGRNNRDLARSLAQALLRSCPRLSFAAAGSARPGRVVFASAHFRDHTVAHITHGLIEKLDRAQFEVIVVRPHGAEDAITRAIDKAADRSVVVSADPFVAREAIANLHSEVIVYPDIGMEPWSYFLGFSRLAPRQLVGWGHADTTGLPEIDGFLTCDAFDPEGAEAFYSEPLRRGSRVLAYMVGPGPTTQRPEGRPRVVIPQSLFKLHPDLDPVLAEIASFAEIVVPEPPYPEWRQLLERRMVGIPLTFVPRVSPDQFTDWLGGFHAILDPIHFTGGYSSFQALAAGLPIVTWSGTHLPGRMTAGMLAQLGVEGLTAATAEAYVAAVREVVQDPMGWRETIGSRREALVEDLKAVREFERLIGP